ncbi:MAG: hypothetical protein H5T73_03590 [Actinobacteria bacterium]|nr:hypothetical protein [Actinomycetota bacterium]
MRERSEALFFRPDEVLPPRVGAERGACEAVVEVAGRDSVAAALVLARAEGLSRLLPAIAYTGTEFDDLGSLFANVERMRRLLAAEGIRVEEPVVVGSPRWWNAVIGRVNSILSRRYGPWHICIGCHMYLHALRVPLCWSAGVDRLVAGERLEHGGRIKVNQTRAAVTAYREVLEEFGVRLELPLLELDDEEGMKALVGEWEEGRDQPSCALAGNYLDRRGGAQVDDEGVRAYLAEYLVPVTKRILAELRKGAPVDYRAAVVAVLENIGE